MENKTKKTTERKSKIIKYIAIAGGAVAIGVAGYIIGDERCSKQIGAGLKMLVDADPTLGDHLWKAYDVAKNKSNG